MEGRHLASPSVDVHAFHQQSASPAQQHQQQQTPHHFDDFGGRLLEPLLSPLPASTLSNAAPTQSTAGKRPTLWRRDEHARFMQALEAFGSAGDAAWAQIAAFVGSRSVEEARRHGQQYLTQLMQQPQRSGAFDWVMDGLSDDETPTGGYHSQNDPGNVLPSFSTGSDALKMAHKPRKTAAVRTLPPAGQQQQQQQQRRNGRRPKVWTFQEDKAFETALAGWTSDKPYSWAKIAAVLPGKSAKDVRNRYEKLLGDVSSIEGATFSSLSLGCDGSGSASSSTSSSTLRQRPPPIDITAKGGSTGAGSSSRSNTLRSASGLLSPTLFDLLDASDGSDRQPFGSTSAFLSPAALKRESKEDAKTSTPRVWREFLADAFKFDESRSPETPSESKGERANGTCTGGDDVDMVSE